METDAAQMAASVETLFKRLSDIQATVDSSIAEPFGDCLDEVDLSRDRMAHLKDTGFGPISTVILPKIQAACQGAWADKLNDSILKVQLSRMETLAKSVSNKVAQVRNDLAEKKADEDLSFAFHAIDTFVNQVNALSVGRLLFDFAHIGRRWMRPPAEYGRVLVWERA